MKLYQFKTKLSEIKSYPFCLGNISNDFAVDNMKRTGLNVYVHDFFCWFYEYCGYKQIFNEKNSTK